MDRQRTLRLGIRPLGWAGWCRRQADPDENLAPALGGAEIPPPGQQRIDAPTLELVIAVRQPQPVVQVGSGLQFLRPQRSAIRIGDLEPGDRIQGEGHWTVHRRVLYRGGWGHHACGVIALSKWICEGLYGGEIDARFLIPLP